MCTELPTVYAKALRHGQLSCARHFILKAISRRRTKATKYQVFCEKTLLRLIGALSHRKMQAPTILLRDKMAKIGFYYIY